MLQLSSKDFPRGRLWDRGEEANSPQWLLVLSKPLTQVLPNLERVLVRKFLFQKWKRVISASKALENWEDALDTKLLRLKKFCWPPLRWGFGEQQWRPWAAGPISRPALRPLPHPTPRFEFYVATAEREEELLKFMLNLCTSSPNKVVFDDGWKRLWHIWTLSLEHPFILILEYACLSVLVCVSPKDPT